MMRAFKRETPPSPDWKPATHFRSLNSTLGQSASATPSITARISYRVRSLVGIADRGRHPQWTGRDAKNTTVNQ